MPNRNDYVNRLAGTLKQAADHRHVTTETWSQGYGVVAFDVELCDSNDLPSGFLARVVVTVTEA